MASSLSPDERALRAKLGAHTLHATHDSCELTANARAAFMQRFVDEVDPDRVLPEDERNRRAEHAKKAYFTRLSFLAARAREAKA